VIDSSIQRLAAFANWANDQQAQDILTESRWLTYVMVGRNRAVTFHATLYRLNADGTESNDAERKGEITIDKGGFAEAKVWNGWKYDDVIMYAEWEGIGPDQFDELFAPFLAALWGEK
jgi:hypothetical protein